MNTNDLNRPTPIETDLALWARERAALIRAVPARRKSKSKA